MKFKKSLSLILSILLLSSVFLPVSTLADTETIDASSYTTYLKNQGFPETYWDGLTALHEKYPNWTFKAFKTGLDWSSAVSGERSYHSKQLIEKSASSSFKCTCSSCYKNGSYVIQEGSTWVSASKTAVEYYMDPRNFLDEKHIFQFEDTSYDSSQTQSGVESIIKNTWMNNSNITYSNVNGNSKTIDEKYSAVIIDAAKESSMSAYYLASKIVQEVGGAKPTAGGASGTYGNYLGIFNYYNIGAYTGAADGLSYANGYMKASAKATLYESADSSSNSLVTIPSGTTTYYKGKSGDFYKVAVVVNSKTYTGYILKSKASYSTSYGRAWTNPQKAIMNGALWIENSFSTHQNTGYLQKFNVNSASGSLYSHEYMANVAAAASESVTTYNAYKNASILSTSKVFEIPVFSGMGDITDQKPSLTLSSYDSSSLTIKWNDVSYAEGYVIYRYNYSTNEYERIAKVSSGLTYTDSKLSGGTIYKYRVRAYMHDDSGDAHWSKYSDYKKFSTAPSKVSTVSKSASTDTTITISWSKVANGDGYQIYRYNSASGTYKYIKEVSGNANFSYKDTGLEKGTSYKYRVRAYSLVDSSKYYGSYSAGTSIKTTGYKTKRGMVTPATLKIKKTASSSAKTIKTLKRYRYVNIIGETTNWYKVKFTISGTSYTGYAPKDNIRIVYNAKITASSLNIRKSASTSSDVLTKLSKNTAVVIIGSSGDWYKIRFTKDGTTYNGYASKSYIVKT